jgi:hypothetical protein
MHEPTRDMPLGSVIIWFDSISRLETQAERVYLNWARQGRAPSTEREPPTLNRKS